MPAVESSPGTVWRRGAAVFSECDADHNRETSRAAGHRRTLTTAQKNTTSVIGRGDMEQSASHNGNVTAAPRPPTAHDSAVLATIAAAYDVAATSGSISLRSHDLLRRLHRSASVLREATARVEKEARTHPDAIAARDALALLHEVRRLGLFYEGYV
jgi:hypothetical protein